MAVASFVIAISALLFTVASFWWLQARRGPLRCFPVQAFSGCLHADLVLIRVPLSIFNSGPVARVAVDLQLRLVPPTGDALTLPSSTFRKSLMPRTDDTVDFVHPFAVPGRSVVAHHVEFARTVGPPASLLAGSPCTAVVEAQVDQDTTWTEVGRFPLHIEIMGDPRVYITYSNHPHAWPEGQREKTVEAFAALRTEMGLPED
ncbi:MAG: hypothetical protein ACR2JK_10035 [Geodermatophilaceae bacterium]